MNMQDGVTPDASKPTSLNGDRANSRIRTGTPVRRLPLWIVVSIIGQMLVVLAGPTAPARAADYSTWHSDQCYAPVPGPGNSTKMCVAIYGFGTYIAKVRVKYVSTHYFFPVIYPAEISGGMKFEIWGRGKYPLSPISQSFETYEGAVGAMVVEFHVNRTAVGGSLLCARTSYEMDKRSADNCITMPPDAPGGGGGGAGGGGGTPIEQPADQPAPLTVTYSRFSFANGAGVIFAKDGRDDSWANLNPGGRSSGHQVEGNRIGAILDGDLHVKEGLNGSWKRLTSGSDVKSFELSGKRIAFSNGAGVIFAKDGVDDSWATLNPGGGASSFELEGDWIGAILDGSFHVKRGLHGSWVQMAGGGDVKKIAIEGDRFAFSNGAGIIHAKDGRDSSWAVLNPDGRASSFVLHKDWIGAILDGSFYVKRGLHGSWVQMAGGGDVKKIAIEGDRFAFSNGAGVIRAKDGRDSSWAVLNPDGRASDFVLEGGWIGAILDGSYYVKLDVNGEWITMAGGGDVKRISVDQRSVTYYR